MQVVVELIMDMHHLGHPSYTSIDEETVRRRASQLPEEGVPPEVLKVLQEVDDAQDKLQPQKAATPCDGMESPRAAGQTFARQRARAIVAEGQRLQDESELGLAALTDLRDRLAMETGQDANAPVQKLEVRTGNQFLDQLRPSYFAIAFPFCFKHATACPDVFNIAAQQGEDRPPPRRQAGNPQAPTVGIQEWAAAMARRVECQFRRDWTFGFTVWNFLFRTMVNLQKNTYMYAIPDAHGRGNRRMLTNKEITDGCLELYNKLHAGTYIDLTGEVKPISQDLTKLRHVAGLSEAAKKVFSNVEAKTRNIPGTHETRRTMRHQTHGNRVSYGTALFITFSPSEGGTTLMARLMRARQSDPAVQQDGSAKFQSRSVPDLEVDYMRLSPEALAEDQGCPIASHHE